MDPDWYETLDGGDLEQGDVLFGLTAFAPTDAASAQSDEPAITSSQLDGLVLTQSCDLAYGKVSSVLLATIKQWDHVVENDPTLVGKGLVKTQEKLARNEVIHLCLLPPADGPPAIPWSVVDFRALYTVHFGYLSDHAESAGVRLRLRSPYREHVAQVFARFMMRVGLPEPLNEFVGYLPLTDPQ